MGRMPRQENLINHVLTGEHINPTTIAMENTSIQAAMENTSIQASQENTSILLQSPWRTHQSRPHRRTHQSCYNHRGEHINPGLTGEHINPATIAMENTSIQASQENTSILLHKRANHLVPARTTRGGWVSLWSYVAPVELQAPQSSQSSMYATCRTLLQRSQDDSKSFGKITNLIFPQGSVLYIILVRWSLLDHWLTISQMMSICWSIVKYEIPQ